MTPATYNFRPQYKGDTFKGIKFTLTNVVSGLTTPLDLTEAKVSLQIKKSLNSAVEKDLTINTGLTVSDPLSGIIEVNKFLVTLEAFKYLYALKIAFSDGTISTYLTGTFEVKQNLI